MKDTPETEVQDASPEFGFAPKDLTDGRAPGHWKSRYDKIAWKYILAESGYLGFLLIAAVCGIVFNSFRYPAHWWNLTPSQSATLARYAYAWLGGTLGGILFAMKWLYHGVAKQRWNLDRSIWRYLTPHISGGLAFATVAILESTMAPQQAPAIAGAKSLSIGFLVGFFSDNAIAKLAEVAETLLGPTRRLAPSRSTDHQDRGGAAE